MCVYVYNMYVLVFRRPGNEQKFGSMSSAMNGSKLNLAETDLEVSLSLLIYYTKL